MGIKKLHFLKMLEKVSSPNVPFVISVGVTNNGTLEMMKISENPCFLLSVPDWERKTVEEFAIPMIQQRLCEIARSKNSG